MKVTKLLLAFDTRDMKELKARKSDMTWEEFFMKAAMKMPKAEA
jgi:hypothetical protein